MNPFVIPFVAEDHYAAISGWWMREDWHVIPLDHLPKIGLVAVVEGTPSAAGWIYQTDSAFCLFEFMIANPEVRGDLRAKALTALFEEVKKRAKELGFKTVFMSVSNDSLIKRLEAQGFQTGDRGMTNLTFRIGA